MTSGTGQLLSPTLIEIAEPQLHLASHPALEQRQINNQNPTQKPSAPIRHSTYVEKPTIINSMKNISQGPISNTGYSYDTAQLVPEHVSALSDEVPVKQYHIAQCRNLLRFNRAAGYLAVTSKRVIFKAERKSSKTTIQREHNIEGIAGIEAVSNCRLSAVRVFIGLITLVAVAALAAAGVIWFTHGGLRADAYVGYFMAGPSLTMVLPWAIEGLREGWPHDIGSISLGVGLVAGFGGVALFFLLRGKAWFKLIFLGISVGGFGASALTYNLYAFVLMVLSMLLAAFGVVLFAWVPDLVISLVSKEGRVIRMVYGRRLVDVFYGAAGAGYAEVAATMETERAIRELGAVIGDIQAMGADGVEKWSE